jgi:predicted DNA-binding protein (MmcQ/YjbR family)
MGRDRVSKYFHALWSHCQAKPGAMEDHPWNETVFKINGNIFAFLGRAESERTGVTVKAPPGDLDSLLGLPFVKRASYIGRFGWVSVAIDDRHALELALELVNKSYEINAAKPRRKATPSGATRTRRSTSRKPKSGRH